MSSSTPRSDPPGRPETDLAPRGADVLRLFAEYRTAWARGEAPAWEDWLAQHPELAPELRRLQDDFERGRQLLQGLRSARPSAHGKDADGELPLDAWRRPDERLDLEVLGVLGRGGMALVEHVRDRGLHRELARKVLPVDARDPGDASAQQRLQRFLREARIHAMLQHPGVLPILDFGLDEFDQPYLLMPVVRGESFRTVIDAVRRNDPAWPLARAVQVLVSVCETVAYAHSRHVVHRDLKPENLMVGSFGEVFVMDWGLAKLLGEPDGNGEETAHADPAPDPACDAMTLANAVLGTPAYMAPEQAAGEAGADPRCDQYSIGATLYELLTGRPPYADRPESATSAGLVAAIARVSPTEPELLAPRAPVELIAICRKAMHREPDKRYAGVAALANDLRAFLADRVVQAHDTGALASASKWIGRNRVLAASLAALVALAVGFPVAFWYLERLRAVELRETNTTLRATQEQLATRVDELRLMDYWNDLANVQRELETGTGGAEILATLDRCDPDLRGWEWRLLRTTADQSVLRLGAGWHAAASTAAGVVSVGGRNFGLHVHGLETGDEITTLHANSLVEGQAFSPDGRWLAYWASDQRLRIVDTRTWSVQHALVFHVTRWPFLEFSPDGRDLFIRRGAKGVAAVDVAEGTVRAVAPLAAIPLCGAVDSDGTLMVGDEDGWIHWLDASCVPTRPPTQVGSAAILDLVPVEDDRALWFATAESRFARLDLESLQVTQEHDLEASAASASIAPDGRSGALTFQTDPRYIWLLDLDTGVEQRLLAHNQWINVEFFGARRLLSRSSTETKVWDLDRLAYRRLTGLGGQIADVSIAPDGASIAFACGGRIGRVETRGGEPRWVDAGLGRLARIRHVGDGEVVALGGARCLRFFDATTLAPRRSMYVEAGGARAMAVARDGVSLLTSSDAVGWHNSAIWDLRPESRPVVFNVASESRDGCFSPDGTRFALASRDGCLSIRDRRTGEEQHRVVVSDMRLEATAWSPDGVWVATGGRRPNEDWTVALVDPDRGEIVAELPGGVLSCLALRFTPDGRLIGGFSDGLHVWDTARRREVLRLPMGKTVTGLDVSADGSVVAAGSTDGELHVWRLRR